MVKSAELRLVVAEVHVGVLEVVVAAEGVVRDPGVRRDSRRGEAQVRLHGEELAHEVLRLVGDQIPARAVELVAAALDVVVQVATHEGRVPAEEDVAHHSERPAVRGGVHDLRLASLLPQILATQDLGRDEERRRDGACGGHGLRQAKVSEHCAAVLADENVVRLHVEVRDPDLMAVREARRDPRDDVSDHRFGVVAVPRDERAQHVGRRHLADAEELLRGFVPLDEVHHVRMP